MSEPEKIDVPELTVNQAHRMICADYLEAVANLIRKGSVTGFEFMWNTQLDKPIGKFVAEANVLVGPVEIQIREAITAYSAEQAKKISVTDLSGCLESEDEPKTDAPEEPKPTESEDDLKLS